MKPDSKPMLDVALVGRRMPGTENIALGCLRAAAEAHGIDTQGFELAGAQDVSRVADRILAAAPSIVGLSLSDGTSCVPLLALGEMLMRRGYRGHVTAGGPFATVARDWLLARYGWLDSVVRFAGEEPLVELARAVLHGTSVDSLPGVTTRCGDGLPAPVGSDVPMLTRPMRGELSTIAGYPVACVIASRGCPGRCSYCGPAALQLHEAQEARRAGLSHSEALRVGITNGRHRSITDLCDELEQLWHERGVRYVSFADEHMLPWRERDAILFLRDLRREMARRGLERLRFGATLRADHLTQDLVDALRAAGLMRIFLGLEFASDVEARRFGRRARPSHALQLLVRLEQRGVASICNLMLVHPYSTPETIRDGIALMGALPAGVIEPIRMMPWHGTELCEHLRREGRLVGNPIQYDYTIEDPVVAEQSRLHGKLRLEALGNYSPAFRMHDAELAVRLAEHLVPGEHRHALLQLPHIRRRVVSLYAQAMADALHLACHPDPEGELSLMIRTRRSADRLASTIDSMVCPLLSNPAPGPTFSPGRAAAAGAVVFCTLAASACGGNAREPIGSATIGDAGTEADVADGRVEDGAVPDQSACSEERLAYEEQLVDSIVKSEVPCFDGYFDFGGDAGVRAHAHYYASDLSYEFELKPCSEDSAALAARAEEGLAAVESLEVPCLEEEGGMVYVSGEADSDVEAVLDALSLAWCGYPYGVTFVIDGYGRVADVLGSDVDQETLDCIEVAMQGMVFPCLAGTEVCSAHATVDY